MIHIVDYGVGNIQALLNVYKRLGIDASRATMEADVWTARRLILPGVGIFDHAIGLLNKSGMRSAIEHRVREGVPLLGICVGMQMLADSSEEGSEQGLGLVPGRVRSFRSHSASATLPLPHMGWNDVVPADGSRLFDEQEENARFYFLHSYYFDSADERSVEARADYGFRFHCAVHNGNVFGVQFHPEKSHHWGSGLLKRFAEI